MSGPGRVLLRDLDVPAIGNLETYREHGGYSALVKAVEEHTPEEIIDLVKASGLRGRGGAGFPTGRKWGFVPQDQGSKYVVCNADESEPGTFKDRQILHGNPHQLLEGIAICAYAVGAETAYVYCRAEFKGPAQRFETAISEARAAGYLGSDVLGSGFSLEIYVHLGAGAYICGEETALLESIEGRLGQPRMRPPFPATSGLYGRPTVVNNVETLALVPPIVELGTDWFSGIGTEKSKGPKIFCLSGDVVRPGNYELPLGTTFRELIFRHGGGVPGDRAIKAILPAGASAPLLTADQLDVAMDFESVIEAGSMLGSASIIVMDETRCMVWAALKMERFFEDESCGKCTPCREGTYWLSRVLEDLETGQGSRSDIDLLLSVCDEISGKVLCPLGDFATSPVTSSILHFRDEYEAHVELGRCPFRNGHR
ncbi:MAG: NADH-quinone oxidoreductase subunit NuoF [Anaerolineae bacterium]